jgi:hypothetical protein
MWLRAVVVSISVGSMGQINVPYTASVFQIGSSIIVPVIQVMVFVMNLAGHSRLILTRNNK